MDLNLQHFENRTEQVFSAMLADDERHPLILRSVSALHVMAADLKPARTPFELIFEGDTERRLPQGCYALEHPELGQQLIFIVPIGPNRQTRRMQYQAIFN